ncbi:hypothetical protein D3C79_879520 [compost metagenome]
MEHGRQVDGDDRIPALHREVFDRRHMLDAGIVDENVDAAELAHRVGEQVLDLRHVAEVRRVMADPGTVAGDFGNRRAGIAKAIEDQVGAGLGQYLGNAQADAAGRAGDDCCLADETHRVLLKRYRWHRT